VATQGPNKPPLSPGKSSPAQPINKGWPKQPVPEGMTRQNGVKSENIIIAQMRYCFFFLKRKCSNKYFIYPRHYVIQSTNLHSSSNARDILLVFYTPITLQTVEKYLHVAYGTI
jgi:hypothetical protein